MRRVDARQHLHNKLRTVDQQRQGVTTPPRKDVIGMTAYSGHCASRMGTGDATIAAWLGLANPARQTTEVQDSGSAAASGNSWQPWRRLSHCALCVRPRPRAVTRL